VCIWYRLPGIRYTRSFENWRRPDILYWYAGIRGRKVPAVRTQAKNSMDRLRVPAVADENRDHAAVATPQFRRAFVTPIFHVSGRTYTADFDSIAGYTNFDDGEYTVSAGESSVGAVTFQISDRLLPGLWRRSRRTVRTRPGHRVRDRQRSARARTTARSPDRTSSERSSWQRVRHHLLRSLQPRRQDHGHGGR
jgi:hypothetical protein